MRHLSVVGVRSRTYLDSERNRCTGDMSPPSDNVIFDNQCYATTPSSSNGNSDMEQPSHCNSRRCNSVQTYQQQSMQSVSTPGSPTSRLLLEYEMHLRNTLEKGMDAESYSLRTFEALLTQSMENLGESLICSLVWTLSAYTTLREYYLYIFSIFTYWAGNTWNIQMLQNWRKTYHWTCRARLTFRDDVSLISQIFIWPSHYLFKCTDQLQPMAVYHISQVLDLTTSRPLYHYPIVIATKGKTAKTEMVITATVTKWYEKKETETLIAIVDI